MTSNHLQTLIWQFRLTWRLAEVHLPALTDEACLWEPEPGSWSVRRSADGNWRPDWAESEPDPPPTITIGWLTWHIIWWWSGLLAAIKNEVPIPREEVFWPGSVDSARRRLEALSAEWGEVLSRLEEGDLERQLAYPWTEPRPLSLALAWCNSELMKNVAEIGYVRLLFEASRRGK
ncbi:MAG TPA: DinB family protein [Anaerolineales bacterium]|nr:DinB family protein [Anaerolineales bacterium]